jgi:hypothetical protein
MNIYTGSTSLRQGYGEAGRIFRIGFVILIPEFCIFIIKSRARNFLHEDILVIYQ